MINKIFFSTEKVQCSSEFNICPAYVNLFFDVINCSMSVTGATMPYGINGISSAGYDSRGNAAVCTFRLYNRSKCHVYPNVQMLSCLACQKIFSADDILKYFILFFPGNRHVMQNVSLGFCISCKLSSRRQFA